MIQTRANRMFTSTELASMRSMHERLASELNLSTDHERQRLASLLIRLADLGARDPEEVVRAIKSEYARAAPLSGPLFQRGEQGRLF